MFDKARRTKRDAEVDARTDDPDVVGVGRLNSAVADQADGGGLALEFGASVRS
jgi:hypothetical protein